MSGPILSNLGPDRGLLQYWTRQGVSLAEIEALIAQATSGLGGGTPIDLTDTPRQILYDSINGWRERPATDRPIWWIGGPTNPPLTGRLTGGGGMAEIDFWMG